MANISDAVGVMELRGTWTESMLRNLNTVSSSWKNYEYYINVDEFAGEEPSIFSAAGRWSLDNTVEKIAEYTKVSSDYKVLRAYEALCREWERDSHAFIQLTYREEGTGNGKLYRTSAVFFMLDGEMFGEIRSNEEYEPTKKNYVELGFYQSEEEMDWLEEEDPSGGENSD
jgi:hypothetical protein